MEETKRTQEQPENKDDKTKSELPYDINMELFTKMINALSKVGGKGENIIDLYNSLNVRKQVASKTSTLLKFVGLANSNNRTIWLTQEGLIFSNSTEEGKREIIMSKLPKKYRVMLNWFKNSKEHSMATSDIRNSVIKIFNVHVGKRLLDSMVVAFCNFFNYFGIVKYTKGKSSKCEITQIGLSLLGEQPENNIENPKEDKNIFDLPSGKSNFQMLIISPMGKNTFNAKSKKEFQDLRKKLNKMWDTIEEFWIEEDNNPSGHSNCPDTDLNRSKDKLK